MNFVTLRLLKDALYSTKNKNSFLVSCKAALDLRTDFLFFRMFFKDSSTASFLLTGSNVNRNLCNLMNGHCYDGTKGVGLKWFLAKPLAEFQLDNTLLLDFISNVSNILEVYNCNFPKLTDFLNAILCSSEYNIPGSLRKYLLNIVHDNPCLCISWLLLLGLWGPDEILKLSESWHEKIIENYSSQILQYKTNPLENDNSFFISEYPADGGIFALGSEIRHTWILKNTGSVVWKDRHLGCINGVALGYPPDSLNIDIPLTHPGEEVHLTIQMTTPADEGTYELYWKVMDQNNNLLFPNLGPVGIHFTVMPENILPDNRKMTFGIDDFVRFASCGKEDTIETLESIAHVLTVHLNFEPVRIRPEIPDRASIAVMLPPTDYSDMHYISFDICSPDTDITELQFEIKPYKKEWMHFKYYIHNISAAWQTVHIPLSSVELRTLKIVEEICFVANTGSFINQDHLEGSYQLKNIRFE